MTQSLVCVTPTAAQQLLPDDCGLWFRFLARLGRNAISVYEAPEMVLLDKKSLKLEGIQDFEWSPAADILCAYQSEQAGGNLPARISLISLPDRTELRQKNLFSVSGKCTFSMQCQSIYQ